MGWKPSSLCLLATFLTFSAHGQQLAEGAEDLNTELPAVPEPLPVTTEEKRSDLQLAIGTEAALFKLAQQDLWGGGLRVRFGYLFAPRWRLELGVAQTLGIFDSGIESFYTAIGVGLNYALNGPLMRRQIVHKQGDSIIAKETLDPGKLWVVYLTANVEQYFLSGSASIIPMTGMLLGFGGELNWRSWRLFGDLKSGYVTSSSDSGLPLIWSVGVIRNFN